jgi:hypothetical protein
VGGKFDFGDQPMFTLACIGIDDLAALESEIERLKALHKVQGGEIKSSSIRSKPLFVHDLIAFLKQQRAPVFIEVVDKKFFICANIVSTLILPAANEVNFTSEAHWLRNVIAEYLRVHIPDAIMRSVIDACDRPSNEAVGHVFAVLLEWLGSRPGTDEVAAGTVRFLEDTQTDFKQLGPDEDFARFLPIPDKGKRDQTYWMLPNLSSFTNIYARINFHHRGRLTGVKLVHDEQAHFDQILIQAKAAAENLASLGFVIEVPHADFWFVEHADLIFEKSTNSTGLQAADCLAGFVMRYVLNSLRSPDLADEASAMTFHRILTMTDLAVGVGVNFVLTSSDIRRLGVYIA